MTDDDYLNSRYSRFVALPTIGKKNMKKIRKAKAVVIGAGGLGSVTATQLVVLGIGSLRLIDGDVVELSNLQRQLLYREKNIGEPKVEAAKNFLEELNPDVEIEIIQENVSKDNVKEVIDSADFVVDALDKFAPRYVVNRECLKKNIPYLFGAVSGLSGNAMTVTRESVCIECVFKEVDDSKLPSNLETGIHPAIIQIIGCLQASEATKIMTGEEPSLTNKLQFCDLGSMQFDALEVKPRDDCFCSKYKE
ncbi:MAG: HesA/MoeB/ThiF family protein [Candidatus Heimdallarchaeota archaeon]